MMRSDILKVVYCSYYSHLRKILCPSIPSAILLRPKCPACSNAPWSKM